jgi:hypothetical protein
MNVHTWTELKTTQRNYMKKFMIVSLAAMSLIGTLYAGSGCCSSKKAKDKAKDTPKECGTCEKTDGSCQKGDNKCQKPAAKK